jgi:hypothetical protein
VPGPLKPLMAIPTTAGTGSETTGVAIFDLESLHAKTGIAPRRLKPTLGYFDPENTRTMPSAVAASTGLDILRQPSVAPVESMKSTQDVWPVGVKRMARASVGSWKRAAEGSKSANTFSMPPIPVIEKHDRHRQAAGPVERSPSTLARL